MFSIYDRKATPMESYQYDHLNKIHTVIPPIEIPIWMEENLLRALLDEELQVINGYGKREDKFSTKSRFLIGWLSNTKWSALNACISE